MILVTSNKTKQLLSVLYTGHVRAGDFQRNWEDLVSQLNELAPGFSVLSDFTQLTTMDQDCAKEVAEVMELLAKAKVGLIIRVIPDPSKDIGVNILSAFHYGRDTKFFTCETLVEAAEALGSRQGTNPSDI